MTILSKDYKNSTTTLLGCIFFPAIILILNIVLLPIILKTLGFSPCYIKLFYFIVLIYAYSLIGRNIASLRIKKQKLPILVGGIICFLIDGIFKGWYYFVFLSINPPETRDPFSYKITESLLQIYGGLLLSPIAALFSYIGSKTSKR